MANAQRLSRNDELRFQDDPPTHLRCPNCHQNYDVVASGMIRHVSRINAALFNYFHCKVCECRFRLLRLRAAFTLATSISLILLGLVAMQMFVFTEQGIFAFAR